MPNWTSREKKKRTLTHWMERIIGTWTALTSTTYYFVNKLFSPSKYNRIAWQEGVDVVDDSVARVHVNMNGFYGELKEPFHWISSHNQLVQIDELNGNLYLKLFSITRSRVFPLLTRSLIVSSAAILALLFVAMWITSDPLMCTSLSICIE